MGTRNRPYSYAAVARHIGVSPQLLCDYRKGRKESISKRMAIRISRITGLTTDELFGMNWEQFLASIIRTMEAAEE